MKEKASLKQQYSFLEIFTHLLGNATCIIYSVVLVMTFNFSLVTDSCTLQKFSLVIVSYATAHINFS